MGNDDTECRLVVVGQLGCRDRKQQEGGMHLRHIQPRSVDWYDATSEDGGRKLEALSPEEKSRLRELGEAEQQISMKAMSEAVLGQQSMNRTLL
jgi:hypothetical protein